MTLRDDILRHLDRLDGVPQTSPDPQRAMMAVSDASDPKLPRQLDILRENFNADLVVAVYDGIEPHDIAALAAACAEDLLMVLPADLRPLGLEYLLEILPRRIAARTHEGE